ncbi:MAG: hypothetical protein NZT61_02645 [Deltaproteobacteria bacterium]|nr:hypothetical protein [Deltaproteobacteria bacterium]MCX7952290.1 hypothetical protein [Deltaproteobacteria bacterium]
MKLAVYYVEEKNLAKAFILETSTGNLFEVEPDYHGISKCDAGIVIFNSTDFITVPVEVPPVRHEKQKALVIRNCFIDEPLFEYSDLVTSLPDKGLHGEIGIGIISADYSSFLKSISEKVTIISILPLEAIVAPILDNGNFIIRFQGYVKFLSVENKIIKESFRLSGSPIDEMVDLLTKKKGHIENFDFTETVFHRLMREFFQSYFRKFSTNLEFREPINRLEDWLFVMRLSRTHQKSLASLLLIFGLIFVILFLHKTVNFALVKYFSSSVIHVSNSHEANKKVEELKQELTRLDQDIAQLAVLTYPNIFAVLASLSKLLRSPVESIEFAPPKLVISGTAGEYSTIENLKKELLRERELFCGVKVENIKDYRNQKKYTFEVALCKAS